MTTTRIIISGTVDLPPEKLEEALKVAKPLIEGALKEKGCLDYDWCPDPLIAGRIRVFERWETEADLQAHFDDRWYTDMRDALGAFGLLGAETYKYLVDIQEPVYDETGTPRSDFFTKG